MWCRALAPRGSRHKLAPYAVPLAPHCLSVAAFVRRNAGTLRTPEDTKLGGPPATGEAAALTTGAASASPAEERWHRIHQNDLEVRR